MTKQPQADKATISVADIESKRNELLEIRRQLEFQLNGIINQLHLIDQLLNPKPPSAPDNTI